MRTYRITEYIVREINEDDDVVDTEAFDNLEDALAAARLLGKATVERTRFKYREDGKITEFEAEEIKEPT